LRPAARRAAPCRPSGRGRTPCWSTPFDHVEWISLHTYLNNYANDAPAFLASPDLMDDFIEEVVAIADAVAARPALVEAHHAVVRRVERVVPHAPQPPGTRQAELAGRAGDPRRALQHARRAHLRRRLHFADQSLRTA
jgi:hypothetical protein